jgi:hypothetical protein
LRRCHQGRSRRFSRTGFFISVQSAASTGCSTLMVRPTGAVVQGHHRSQGRYRVCGLPGRTRCGAGTSPTCPPSCVAFGCTSFWWTTSGAARWWPGTSPNGKTQPSQPIWWQGLHPRADQQGPQAAPDPACRYRQRHASVHSREPAGGAGCAPILLQVTGAERQPVLRITVQNSEISA